MANIKSAHRGATSSIPQRIALVTLFLGLAAAFAACGGEVNKKSSSGGDGGDDGGSGGGGGGGSAPTDEKVCSDTCSKMILECGIAYDSTCPAGCVKSPAFLGCVKGSSSDCDALAQCALVQGCGALAPSGAGTCKEAQDCQATQCIGNPDPNCTCNCLTGMSPAKANDLLRVDQCSLAKCGFPCGMTGNAVDCDACFKSQCAGESASCQAN